MAKEYTIFKTCWCGIAIEIRFQRAYIGFADDGRSLGHMEIESVNRIPLPMTETGYRSHFIEASKVDAFGGALEYALSWLEAESHSPKWVESRANFDQLSLF